MKPFLFFVCLLPIGIAAQSTVASKYAATIIAEDIKTHVYNLASDQYEGRETGQPGNVLAADYLAKQFASFGIPVTPGDDNYYQEVSFTTVKWKDIHLMANGAKVEHLKDFLSIPQYFPVLDQPVDIDELTFLGYGIDDLAYSDYEGKNVVGKHLLVYGGEPRDKKGRFLISGEDSTSIWTAEPLLKVNAARLRGAASIWIIDDKLRDRVMFARKYLLTGSTQMASADKLSEDFIPHAFITPRLAEDIIGNKKKKIIQLRNKISKTGKSQMTSIPAQIQWKPVHEIQSTPGMNVLGYIEGSDPVLKNEVVVVSAHYDHLGKRGKEIFYGADDNASGTAAVLEIAQAMAIAKANHEGPRRSVLCLLVTGEEKGLLGSQYYTEHPIFPLSQTVADVNIDMIGRVDTIHKSPNYIYVIGSDRLSSELHLINETVNQQYTQLELDYTYNRPEDPNRYYYRSDHYNFAKHGIPSIFYFSGAHEDYHRPGDTPDKIMYDKAETISRLAFHTAWEIANRDQRLKVDVKGRS